MIKPDKIVLGNRKNISLKIDRTGKLIVSAPRSVDLNKVFDFISVFLLHRLLPIPITFYNNIIPYPTIFVKNKVCKKADTFMYKISATKRLRLKLFSKKMVLKNFLGWC